MKISLCCTVKNEKLSIRNFIDSILGQIRIPDEIVIVDGGSSDGTIDLLRLYQKDYSDIIRIIVVNTNIARGRNIGIREAKYDYIVSADAGTEYPNNWLKNLSEPLEKDPSVDIVSGFFEPVCNNIFEECIGSLLYPKLCLMNWEKFLPSARSVVFKKNVWKDIGGYAEWLPRGIGEDSHFFITAKNLGYKFAYAKNATCYWRPRTNPINLFKQYFYYSQGAAFGKFSKTFIFEAYGTNPIIFTFNNLGGFIKNGKLFHFMVSLNILTIIFMAKLFGTISGKIKMRRKSRL